MATDHGGGNGPKTDPDGESQWISIDEDAVRHQDEAFPYSEEEEAGSSN